MKWQLIYGWLLLFITIITSVIGTFYMKLAEGFRHLKPTILFIIFYAISFIVMTFALQYMELSVLYAVWSGVGTLLVALTGVMYFHEKFTFRKGFFLMLIIFGVIGIHLS